MLSITLVIVNVFILSLLLSLGFAWVLEKVDKATLISKSSLVTAHTYTALWQCVSIAGLVLFGVLGIILYVIA
jgi:hypothetical protein